MITRLKSNLSTPSGRQDSDDLEKLNDFKIHNFEQSKQRLFSTWQKLAHQFDYDGSRWNECWIPVKINRNKYLQPQYFHAVKKLANKTATILKTRIVVPGYCSTNKSAKDYLGLKTKSDSPKIEASHSYFSTAIAPIVYRESIRKFLKQNTKTTPTPVPRRFLFCNEARVVNAHELIRNKKSLNVFVFPGPVAICRFHERWIGIDSSLAAIWLESDNFENSQKKLTLFLHQLRTRGYHPRSKNGAPS